MSGFCDFTRSSVGKKQLMALSGLALSLFLVGHLSGNFLLFAGPEKFNAYANYMSTNPLLIPIELLLLSIFLLHVGLAITLTRQNRAARPFPYAVKDPSGASMASRSMIYTGILIFLFVPLHLIHFKYAPWHGTDAGLYGVVVNKFALPAYSLPYAAAMIAMGFHLAHALQSCLRTFGLVHPGHTPWIQRLCLGLALFLSAGFTAIPLWFLIQGHGGA